MPTQQISQNTVSIVVATARRGALLDRLLTSLVREASGWITSVTVAVDGPPDQRTEQLIHDPELNRALAMTWIPLPISRRPGAVRNVALAESHSEWVLFLDDDAYLPLGFGSRMAELMSRASDFDILGGPNLTPPESSKFQLAVGKVLGSPFGAWFSHRRFRFAHRRSGVLDHDLMLCNLLVRRSALLKAGGGFDPKLVCAEENELIRHMISHGARAQYHPAFWVFHDRRPRWFAFVRQVFIYGRGRVQAQLQSPGGLHPAHLIPAFFLLYISGLLLNRALGLAPFGPKSILEFVPLAVYMALAFGEALRTRDQRVLYLFPSLHLSYGLGILWEGGCHGYRKFVRTFSKGIHSPGSDRIPNPGR